MYMVKRIGPKTLPCGTPVSNGAFDEKLLSTRTRWVRSERYDFIQASASNTELRSSKAKAQSSYFVAPYWCYSVPCEVPTQSSGTYNMPIENFPINCKSLCVHVDVWRLFFPRISTHRQCLIRGRILKNYLHLNWFFYQRFKNSFFKTAWYNTTS